MLLKYIGLVSYDEYPLTGHAALWQPGETQDVSGSRASLLVGSGYFTNGKIKIPEYKTMTEFEAAGGAAANPGANVIAGKTYYSNGRFLKSDAGEYVFNRRPRYAMIGDSTISRGSVQLSTGSGGTLTASGTTATLSYTAHGLNVGNWFTLQNYNQSEFNGVFQGTIRVDENTLKFELASAPTVSTATGSGVLVSHQQLLDRDAISLSNFMAGCPGLYIGNFSQGGSYSNHLDRQIDLLLNPANNIWGELPDIVFISTGINDFNNSISVSTVSGYINAAIARLEAAGILPVLFTNYPLGTSYASYTQAADLKSREYNRLVRSKHFCELFIDAWTLCASPVNVTTWKTNYTTDHIHPEKLAAWDVAKQIKSTLWDNVTFTDDIVKTDVIITPLMTGTGGIKTGAGVSGDVADGKKVESTNATVVCAKGISPIGYGEAQLMTVTADANGDSVAFKLSNTTALISGGYIAEGDRVFGRVKVKTREPLAIYRADIAYTTTVNGFVSTNSVSVLKYSIGAYNYTEALDLDIELPLFKIPANMTSFDIWLIFKFSGADADCVFEVSDFHLYKVS